jgi:hypothetical protein
VTTHTARVAIGCILFAGGCGWSGDAALAQAAVRERILGAWQLESRIVRKASGEALIDPVLGQQPTGRLFYDASGHMALEMTRQGRSQPISKDATNPRIMLGYDAYFGTFRLNEPDGTITHHVEGSLFPEDLGKDFQRGLKVDGDTLTLSFTSRSPEGFDVTRTLRFRRLK